MVHRTLHERRVRRLRHHASVRAYRWLAERRVFRLLPGEHYCVNSHELRLAHLPRKLEGMRIVQLTDLHVGLLLRPEHLPGIVEAANAAGGDMIVVTGDFIDSSNAYLPAIVEAMGALRAPLGVYFVMGNHDYHDNGEQVKGAFREARLDLLMNEVRTLEHRGHSVAVGGIDYAGRARHLQHLVSLTCKAIGDAELRILLAHHPHAFDTARDYGVDLTLSGHTHGGQWVIRRHKGDERRSFGLGNFAWRYPQGLYRSGDSLLYVSNGLGGSFPLRLRCPAEISVLELRRGGGSGRDEAAAAEASVH